MLNVIYLMASVRIQSINMQYARGCCTLVYVCVCVNYVNIPYASMREYKIGEYARITVIADYAVLCLDL